ncbi:MAG: OmpA family protein [Magnetospirillum sp. WYHS-4]
MLEILTGATLFVLGLFGLQDDGNLVVLLENPDGSVGAITVTNSAGSQTLDKARQGTAIGGTDQAPGAPVTLTDEQIRVLFGQALDAQPPRPSSYLLYFETGSPEPTAASRAELEKALRDAAARRLPEVDAIGHTDRVGDAAGNFRLGFERAATVREFLIRGGIPSAAIETRSHGEGDPLVKTPDETPEPRNRRVEIMVR